VLESGDLLQVRDNFLEVLEVQLFALGFVGEEVVDFAAEFLFGLLEFVVVVLVFLQFVHAVDDLLGHEHVLVLAKQDEF
jgi:hypothetical protein